MPNPIIEVQNLSKMYHLGRIGVTTLRDDISRFTRRLRGQIQEPNKGGFWALKDVSFSLQPAEVIGIIGGNGAGKSTLLKVLSRITEPTSGRAVIRGRVASLLEVGTGFHPDLTGRENIFLNGAILGMRRPEVAARLDDIIAFAEVERFIDTPVKHYSSGMYVRLAFAVAAHLEPEILIVDEVLAVGDLEFQQRCLGRMRSISSRSGCTVLLVSHNMTTVLGLCSRTLLMNHGRVARFGPTFETVESYISSSVPEDSFTRGNASYGDGRVKVESLAISSGPPRTGDPFSCEIKVRRPDDSTGQLRAECALDFFTETGSPVLQLFSRHVGCEFSLRPGTSSLTVKIDRLPLVPGKYHLGVWLGSGQVDFDGVPDCYRINVLPGYLHGSALVENRGIPVIAPSRWALS